LVIEVVVAQDAVEFNIDRVGGVASGERAAPVASTAASSR